MISMELFGPVYAGLLKVVALCWISRSLTLAQPDTLTTSENEVPTTLFFGATNVTSGGWLVEQEPPLHGGFPSHAVRAMKRQSPLINSLRSGFPAGNDISPQATGQRLHELSLEECFRLSPE